MGKINKFQNYLSEYFFLLGDNKKKYGWLLFLFLISSVFDMLGIGLIAPFIQLATQPEITNKYNFLKYFSDFFLTHNSFIIFTGILIAIIFYVKSIVGYYVQKMIMTFSFNNKAYLINRLMKTYQHLDYSFHVKRNSASLIQRLLENTNIYTEMTLISSLRFLSEAIVIISIIGLLAYSSFIVTLVMVFLLSALILLYDKIVKKHFHRYGEQLLVSSEEILKWFNQAIYGFKEIKVLGAENFFYNKVHDSGITFANAASYAQALQAIPRYVIECVLLTMVVGMVITTLLLGGNINSLLPILGMFAIASFRLIPSVNKAATSFTNLRYSRQAMYDLNYDLSLIGNSSQIQDLNTVKLKLNSDRLPFHSIELKEISFRYVDTKHDVLSKIDLTIKAGECIGFVGKSGSGKTTLVDILLGLYEPSTGSVFVDGINMKDTLQKWRSKTAYIPQNFFLLDDDLKSNITLERDPTKINHQKLTNVIQEASLEDVIKDLPQGLNSIIGEHGVKLSGGQRQRIALARAFYHDRELIIMDEATSSLDAETETQIVETIVKMKGLKTMIVIAHRKSTLHPCDKIYELDQGRLSLLTSH